MLLHKTGLGFAIKRLLLLPLLLLLQGAAAQSVTINGLVVDAATNKPLVNASVFINGTSRGTVTDAQGNFQLVPAAAASYEIIVSYVGYTTVQFITKPGELARKFRFELAEQEAAAKDVVVEPDVKDGWNKWGRTFLQSFIGQSELADRCTLRNPEVLRFKYSSKTRKLQVIARDALQIDNDGLGYHIRYQLEQFEIDNRSGMTFFLGYQFYTPYDTKRERKENKYKAARREAYNGSLLHYIRSAYNHNLAQDGFETRLLKKVEQIDSSLVNGHYVYRTKKYDLLDKNILADSVFIKTDSGGTHQFLVFEDYLDVTYLKENEKPAYVATQYPIRKPYHPISQLWLVNRRPVQIEANGLFFDPLDLFTLGYWGWEKLAETVPTDYEPGD
ncbi:MAG: carboxypeptidase-like regulatory domain-containing protein [Chitinophagaceae bacterium]